MAKHEVRWYATGMVEVDASAKQAKAIVEKKLAEIAKMLGEGTIFAVHVQTDRRRQLIAVLNDQRTFADLDGTSIWEVPRSWDTEQIEEAMREEDEKMIKLIEF